MNNSETADVPNRYVAIVEIVREGSAIRKDIETVGRQAPDDYDEDFIEFVESELGVDLTESEEYDNPITTAMEMMRESFVPRSQIEAMLIGALMDLQGADIEWAVVPSETAHASLDAWEDRVRMNEESEDEPYPNAIEHREVLREAIDPEYESEEIESNG